MGADLYIKSITDKAETKYGPKFSAAIERRNAMNRDLECWQQIVATRESIGGCLPSLDRELQTAKEKVEQLKGRIQVAQNEVERYCNLMQGNGGYYRDSYNGTSVLWRLELFWWKDTTGGKMTPGALKALLAKIKSRKLKPVTEAELKDQHCTVDAENSVKTWGKFYQNKKRRLVRFLTRAVAHAEKGEEVYFSL